MELVIDASIMFTAITGKGVTKDIMFSDTVKLYAPEHLLDETEEHKSGLIAASSLSDMEVDSLFDRLKARVEVIERAEFEKFLKKANELLIDKDDTEYVALSLAMATGEPVWSNDSDLKRQKAVMALTTEDVIKLLS